VPGETYRLIPQVFVVPVEPGLHPMRVGVMSCGASFVHSREIDVYGFVDEQGLAHLELENGDVVHWWRWDKDRDKERARLREDRVRQTSFVEGDTVIT
jgi:hypothetical protein